MNTEERLRAALAARATSVRSEPTDFDAVRTRARQQRRTTLVAATASIAVVAAAVAVVVPRLDSDHIVMPIDRSPSSTTSVLPSPTRAVRPTLSADEFVALQPGGFLVVRSAADGSLGRFVAQFDPPGPGSTITIDPARKAVYASTTPTDDHYSPTCATEPPVQRHLLASGQRDVVGHGRGVAVSPDGRRLAFISECVDSGGAGGGSVVVLDTVTGGTKSYANVDPDVAGANPRNAPWRVAEVVWDTDSRHLWVVMDWEGSYDLRRLDTTTAQTLGDAPSVPLQHPVLGLERRGDDLVFRADCCFPEYTEPDLVFVRSPKGVDREIVRGSGPRTIGDVEVGPDGDLLYVQKGTLYRLDLDSGETSELGPLATDTVFDW